LDTPSYLSRVKLPSHFVYKYYVGAIGW